MKKITMFVEELSDDYSVLPFYPVNSNQKRLKSLIENEKTGAFEEGMTSVLEFIDKNPAPAAGAKLAISDNGENYEAHYVTKDNKDSTEYEDNDYSKQYQVSANDIMINRDGCFIDHKFVPAGLLMAAANAVLKCSKEG